MMNYRKEVKDLNAQLKSQTARLAELEQIFKTHKENAEEEWAFHPDTGLPLSEAEYDEIHGTRPGKLLLPLILAVSAFFAGKLYAETQAKLEKEKPKGTLDRIKDVFVYNSTPDNAGKQLSDAPRPSEQVVKSDHSWLSALWKKQ